VDVHTGAKPHVAVEVTVDSVAGARAAAAAGADRLELCCALLEGGTTPSPGLLAAVRAAVAVPVFAMLRPRGGDFLYDEDEFDVMLRDAAHLRAAGASGFVAGALTAAGELDAGRLAALRAATAPLPLVCHRAFDLCADPHAALAALVRLGVDRVLTSGQARSAPEGAVLLRELVLAAGGRIAVMAGAGVRDANVAELVARTGVTEVHLSATAWRDSGMQFRRPGVPMGASVAPSEYARRETDGGMVARVVAALRGR